MSVSVIIPTWNRRELLDSVLERLAGQTLQPAEIIVVDNGSSDGSAELARSRGARVIPMAWNAGFARAVNRGIEVAGMPWLAVLNNDVEPEPEWLERLLAAAEREQAWFATGKLLNAARPDCVDGIYDLVSRAACAWRVGSGHQDGAEFSAPRRIAMASATATLFRAELFAKIGLFEERFESYLEDVDLGLRCAAAGLAGVYTPDAVASHRGSATWGAWTPRTVRLISRNQLLLVARHYSRGLVLRNLWRLLLGQALWGILAARHGCAWAFLRGKWEGLWMCGRLRAAHSSNLEPVLEASEREILMWQRRLGFDWYWRLYFLLSGGGAK